jgi:superfamily II DNA helicase RecQ
LAKTAEQLAEERRLLYVGLTRAKRILWVTWSGKASPFLRELGATSRREPIKSDWTPAGERLRAWRLDRARSDGVPPYVVFHDRVLHEIADTRPSTLGELAQIPGVGPAKLERYGPSVLAELLEG